jgi:erythromycin esterase-like protein
MWRNADVLDLVGWLRDYNRHAVSKDDFGRVGFYGMDLYSLYASIDAVVRYLDDVDPEAARRARSRYGCFEEFEKDSQAYGYAAAGGMAESCEDEVVAQLVELQQRAAEHVRRDGRDGEHDLFYAEQNARVARNAERYYRTMFRGGASSWNLRDTHMVETLAALTEHLERRRGGGAKVIVWAHNSHLGDARATAAAERGEVNVGQLVRERWGAEAFLVGFSSYTGTVTAARDWDMPAERRRLRPALPESYEALLHNVAESATAPDFYLSLRENDGDAAKLMADALNGPRLERFVGVIYRPETERWSHYYECALPRQFDAVFHYDESRAVEPLERTARWVAGESGDGDPPQTYPWAA